MAATPRVPLVHITDLYHPAQDPDDQFDLATVLALPEIELKAVLLDVTRKFLIPAPEGWDRPRDPGLVTVKQAAMLRGESIPVAVGPVDPLADEADDASDRPASEQGAIQLLLEVLSAADQPVAISVVGSARILAAALRRDPALVKRQVSAVWLNAGSTVRGELEWNVTLDPVAFRILWRSGVPIRWFPCATENGAFDPQPERGTHWSATHAALVTGLPARWRGWFAYGWTGSDRTDHLAAMTELAQGPEWEKHLADRRSMWSTASLAMAAGRVLARTTEAGWRFLPANEVLPADLETWPWRLDPIAADVLPDSHIEWNLSSDGSPHRLFGRRSGAEYGEAMAQALNALFMEQLDVV
ncbi:MAG: hypothetical protein SynsKO_03590 [Synoicihabitans sp.]